MILSTYAAKSAAYCISVNTGEPILSEELCLLHLCILQAQLPHQIEPTQELADF
ncbi:MAG: hypothetical protein SFV23_03345 [Planctomycetaceae bacterium]|nr:hypothetical protein [Planctomycetaceae bacterium]